MELCLALCARYWGFFEGAQGGTIQLPQRRYTINELAVCGRFALMMLLSLALIRSHSSCWVRVSRR